MEEKTGIKKKMMCCDHDGCGGIAYFLGIIGAAVYYMSTAAGFWPKVLGFLKALAWPAFLVFEVLKYLGK